MSVLNFQFCMLMYPGSGSALGRALTDRSGCIARRGGGRTAGGRLELPYMAGVCELPNGWSRFDGYSSAAPGLRLSIPSLEADAGNWTGD